MKRAVAAVAAITLALVAAPAFAEKTPISALPTMPAPRDAKKPPKVYGVPGLTVKERDVPSSTYFEAIAATKEGYCIVQDQGFLSLTDSSSDNDDKEMWRFTEHDGGATLERTRFELVTFLENAWVKSKTSVELHQVANDKGVTVWSMRQANGDILFFAGGAEGGREAHVGRIADNGGDFGNANNSGCSFGATRVAADAIAAGGGVAQLSGSLPPVGEGKNKVVPHYIVDISALKVSRDPEPILTLRVRVTST